MFDSSRFDACPPFVSVADIVSWKLFIPVVINQKAVHQVCAVRGPIYTNLWPGNDRLICAIFVCCVVAMPVRNFVWRIYVPVWCLMSRLTDIGLVLKVCVLCVFDLWHKFSTRATPGHIAKFILIYIICSNHYHHLHRVHVSSIAL